MSHYLSRLLESYGFEIVASGPINEQFLASLAHNPHDVLLIDRYQDATGDTDRVRDLLARWPVPVIYNDSMLTELSLQQGNPGFGEELVARLTEILDDPAVAGTGL